MEEAPGHCMMLTVLFPFANDNLLEELITNFACVSLCVCMCSLECLLDLGTVSLVLLMLGLLGSHSI